jgi:hypothetical protein
LKIVKTFQNIFFLYKEKGLGVDGSFHFTVLSMDRLNQTEPATFLILPCWAFFRDSYFSLCYRHISVVCAV